MIPHTNDPVIPCARCGDLDGCHLPAKIRANRLSLEEIWEQHAAWSRTTFGSDQERGPIGSLKHLAKEVQEARHEESFRPIQLANAIGCPHGSITAVLKHPWFLIGVNGEVNLTLAAKADVGTADEGSE